MAYHIKILNNTSLQIAAIINRIQMQAELRQELVKPISGIWLGKPVYASQWAGNGELNSFVPYLAGKGDLIAFDYSSKPITAQFAIEYLLGCNHNELVILPMLQSDDDLQSIFPLLAELMFHTNDIDVSDDNFRAWLIANRPIAKPKGKIMNMPENCINDALFKFLQLKEHAGDVKITQEVGQQLFNVLVDHANAIAHEEVSGDGAPTDTSEFILELVNNLINSAKPKPSVFQRVGLDYFHKMEREYHKRDTQLMLRWADSTIFVPVTDDVAEKCFGEHCAIYGTNKMWFFKVDGVLCRAFGKGRLEIVVSRIPFAEVRKTLDRILDVVNEAMNEGKEKD